MPLPDNFSPVEHLQDTLKRFYNNEVRDHFKDLGGDEWDPDISTSRGSMRLACTHVEDDTMNVTFSRMMLFESFRARFRNALVGIEDNDSVGVSRYISGVQRKLKVQIKLYFIEDAQDVEAGYAPVTGQIGFRVMDEDADSMTEQKATLLANKIALEFGAANGFIWRKGKAMASYTDWDRGYQLQLLVRSLADAKELIGKILDIQTHTPDWEKLQYKENDQPTTAYPTIPPIERIYGKQRRTKRTRPIASVRYVYSKMFIEGLQNPIVLHDRTSLLNNALST